MSAGKVFTIPNKKYFINPTHTYSKDATKISTERKRRKKYN